jgi:hypothetical protein
MVQDLLLKYSMILTMDSRRNLPNAMGHAMLHFMSLVIEKVTAVIKA